MPSPRNATVNLRRYVLTGAILVVAAVFLFRDNLIQDWSGVVDEASRRLVEGQGVRPVDPALKMVHDLAMDTLGTFRRPLAVGPPDVSRSGSDLQAVVRVVGAEGRELFLTWRGRPPQLTDVRTVATGADSVPKTTVGESEREGIR